MSLEVVTARPGDFAAVADLVDLAYAGVDYRAAESLPGIAGRAGSSVLVAKQGTLIVGTVTIAATGSPGEFTVLRFAVSPAYQGRGIGRAILESLIEEAPTVGLRAIVGYSMDTMTSARRLYESLGAVRDPSRDVSVGTGRKAYYYRLLL